ncbi:MAG: PEP-CTERM sorting domain-containing protein [Candidatus Eisenbacteria sp.]|nr:PEP-CTERM sorting domain-containing protein [Candidatus Eisenbacteria bacterium]
MYDPRRFSTLWITLIAIGLCFTPTSAFALSIMIGGPGGVTIFDGGVGDTNPAAGIIGFTQVLAGAGFGATGTLSEVIVPGLSATLTLTDLVIGQSGGVAVINNNISFDSSVFAPIGPPNVATVHLDGEYVKVGPGGILPAGGIINNADTQLGGFVNTTVLIGVVNPPGVAGVASNIAFGPPNVNSSFGFGITSLHGSLPFQLGQADGIHLPGSAMVSAVVPEPSTLLLLVPGLMGLAGFGRKRLLNKLRKNT